MDEPAEEIGSAVGKSMPAAAVDPAMERAYDTLIKLQRVDGSWEVSDAFWDAMAPFVTSREAASAAVGSSDVAATLLVVLVFEAVFGDREDEWRLMVSKARDFASQQTAAGPSSPDDISNALLAVVA